MNCKAKTVVAFSDHMEATIECGVAGATDAADVPPHDVHIASATVPMKNGPGRVTLAFTWTDAGGKE